jgi:preprotein translocase subunit SecG
MKLPKIKITSRRERMTYWLMVIWFISFIIAVCVGISLLDLLAYFGGLTMVVGWYTQKETEQQSKNEI